MIGLILALVVLGVVLLVVEAHVPTYGVLGVGGLAAFVAAIVLAAASSGGSVALAVGVAVPVAGALAGAGIAVGRKALAVGRQRPRGGSEGLVGHIGVVRRPLDPLGQVFVDGELWRARRSWVDEQGPPPREGEPVLVERVQGLTLSVRRAEEWEVEA